MPPDYDQLPLPGTINNKDILTDKENIKDIISKTPKEKNKNTIEDDNESLERSILKKIIKK